MYALHKKFIRESLAQGVAEDMITLLDVLIVFSKKFGRQLSHPAVQSLLLELYPDAAKLYQMLAVVVMDYPTLHRLRHILYLGLGTHHITVRMSHDVSFAIDTNDLIIGSSGPNPSLFVQSGDKIYRRSLYEDLFKIVSH